MAEVGINELTAKISLRILLRKPKYGVISFYWSDRHRADLEPSRLDIEEEDEIDLIARRRPHREQNFLFESAVTH